MKFIAAAASILFSFGLLTVVDPNIPLRVFIEEALSGEGLGRIVGFLATWIVASGAAAVLGGALAEAGSKGPSESREAATAGKTVAWAFAGLAGLLLAHAIGLVFQFAVAKSYPEAYGFDLTTGSDFWIRCLLGWWFPVDLVAACLVFLAVSNRRKLRALLEPNRES